MIPIPLLIIGGGAALGAAIASRWESDNEEDEEELERKRERKNRFLRMRRSQLEKNKRKISIKLELAAREKELSLVERAEKIAKRQMDCGVRELSRFREELDVANQQSVKLSKDCIDAMLKDLTVKQKDFRAIHRKCMRYATEVRNRIDKLNGSRFYFKCVSCRKRFAVRYEDIANFLKSRKGMRKCCDNCYPRLKERSEKRKRKISFIKFSGKLAIPCSRKRTR